MSDDTNVQSFHEDGTWDKPARARTVDVTVLAACAGDGLTASGERIPGAEGEAIMRTYAADELPDHLSVTIGRGGRGAQMLRQPREMEGSRRWTGGGDPGGAPELITGNNGSDGHVLFVTHLRPEEER